MGLFDGKVAIVTGAGRGLGREHALLLAAEGARVMINDLGGSTDGSGNDGSPAQDVAAEIRAAGGTCAVNGDDVADWDGARRLVEETVETLGGLDVLVNNAGILRDRMLVNMSAEEWDDVVRVHLRGHFGPSRFAADYWRGRSRESGPVGAAVVNTSSTSGVVGNIGQTNYGAAKAGIAAFTVIAAKELERYGVRVNAIVPAARTRLTEQTPGLGAVVAEGSSQFDPWDPANVSPMVAYLASDLCRVSGAVFFAQGGRVARMRPWSFAETIVKDDGRWEIRELAAELDPLLGEDAPQPLFF
jgi:NAD(P)-dependent dehydrogenase (short-subunit alcohol dehydrogenase family)